MARVEGWIREGEFDHPQQAWSNEGICDEAGKGLIWATPLALLDEPAGGFVVVLLEGWGYTSLGVRRLSADSVGVVLPGGW